MLITHAQIPLPSHPTTGFNIIRRLKSTPGSNDKHMVKAKPEAIPLNRPSIKPKRRQNVIDEAAQYLIPHNLFLAVVNIIRGTREHTQIGPMSTSHHLLMANGNFIA